MATARLDRDEVKDNLLPKVCLQCGAVASAERKKTFSWVPSWTSVLILAGVLPYAIVAMILTKRMTVYAPFCAAHKNHWTWRTWFLYGGLGVCGILLIAVMMLFAAPAPPRGIRTKQVEDIAGFLCFGTFVLGLVWLIAAAIIQHTSIRTTEITDDGITLVNVSRDFVEALEEYRERDDAENRYRLPSRERRPPRDWSRDEDDDAFRERGGR